MNYRLAATHCTHHAAAAEPSMPHVRRGQHSIALNTSTTWCGMEQQADSLRCKMLKVRWWKTAGLRSHTLVLVLSMQKMLGKSNAGCLLVKICSGEVREHLPLLGAFPWGSDYQCADRWSNVVWQVYRSKQQPALVSLSPVWTFVFFCRRPKVKSH